MTPSLQSQIWRQIIQFMFRRKNLSIFEERARSERTARFHPPFPRSIQIDYYDIDGMGAAIVEPLAGPQAAPQPGLQAGPQERIPAGFQPVAQPAPLDPIVLYFHGGGYVLGSIESSLLLCVPLAEALALPVCMFEYRLAPEHPHPAALDDALTAYDWLRSSGYQSEQILFLGDSAGGGLALATAMALRDRGEPPPGALLLYSPWTDLTNSSASHRTNAGRDVMLTTDMLQRWARSYAGHRPLDDPYISPRFGTFAGLPPMLIQVDESEILLDDSRLVADAARAAGVPVELEIWQGLWHVWPAVGNMIPETALSFQRIQDFLSCISNYTKTSTGML